ncbi:MAG: O-antigen ligase family protein [Pirellulaceae bacterium]|jgi:O-antigen ligase|nr:O-antigen ligase family protein [Pirellulaceae bacterium]MDP7017232.1 O-antigen ligase family protein [Pirellulaceae bacterium]
MTLVFSIAGVVALIWMAVALRYGGLHGIGAIALAAGVWLGHPFFNIDVGPAPITIDRVALLGLIGLYVAHRFWRRTDPKPLTFDDGAIAFFLAVLLVSSIMHGGDAVSTWVFLFGLPAAFYWILRQSPLDERATRTILHCLLAIGFCLAATGIAEWRGWHGVVFPRYISSTAYEEFFGRARGPLLNPIGNGIYLSVALGAGAALFFIHRPTSRRTMIVAAGVLVSAGLYATLTRSVWLGAIAVIGIFALFPLPKNQRIGAIVLGSILAIGALGASWSSLSAFKRDKDVSVHHMSQSAKLRPLLADIAWQMFRERPLFGCGFRQYSEASIEYINARRSDMALEVARGYVQHNVFLALLCETGIIGLSAYAAMLIALARRAWRLAASRSAPDWAKPVGLLMLACLAAVSINGMFHDVSVIAMVNALMFFVAGVTASLSLQFEPVRGAAAAKAVERRGQLHPA